MEILGGMRLVSVQMTCGVTGAVIDELNLQKKKEKKKELSFSERSDTGWRKVFQDHTEPSSSTLQLSGDMTHHSSEC